MRGISRRLFGEHTLHFVLAAGLLQHASRAQALTGSIRWSARPWLRQLDAASTALAEGSLAPAAWQDEVTAVLGRLDLDDLRRSLDLEALAAIASYPARGEGMQRVYFPDAEGRLQPLRMRPYLFSLRAGGAVVPHGHHNMATMHMMLSGQARVRHYERLEASATHMLLRPASDETARPGHVSTISDDRNNVHWFQAGNAPVLMFNIGVPQVQAGKPFGERDYVDPLAGIDAGGGVLRAPRLDRTTAYASYGQT